MGMPPKVQKSKAAKLLAAQSSSKSKGKKKKWSKGKLREKRNHKVVYNGQNDLEKVLKEVPKKMKVITVYGLVEAYKINGSLARRTIRELLKRGSIKTVLKSAHLGIYTKSAKAAKQHKKEKAAKAEKAKNKGKKGKKKKGGE